MTFVSQDLKPWFPLLTARLRLREFTAADLDDIHAYGSDAAGARVLGWGPNTPEGSEAVLCLRAAGPENRPPDDVSLAMERHDGGGVIGAIRLWIVDEPNRTAELGYSLASRCWRQGYGTEAAQAMMAAGFEMLGLHRVVATCDVRNAGSFGVMEKIGMRREAMFRQDRLIKGVWRDTYLYARLAEDHFATP